MKNFKEYSRAQYKEETYDDDFHEAYGELWS